MRLYPIVAPLLLTASAAFAAAPLPPPESSIEIPPQKKDPHFNDRLMDMSDALSKAFLDLKVGEVEAAAEGRPVTAADRDRTVGQVVRISPQELDRQIAEARPKVEAATQALARELPKISRSLSEAARGLKRAADNMPQPYDPNP
jgi:hypothetical protein